MPDISLKITLEPEGLDRFAILISGNNRAINKRIDAEGLGFTEEDLRGPNGLPKCGLTESQIDKAIARANGYRTKH